MNHFANLKGVAILFGCLALLGISCQQNSSGVITIHNEQGMNETLPILGFDDTLHSYTADGKLQIDSVSHFIRDFEFFDQDSNRITGATFKNRIYVTDFFFTRCPSICPRMKVQMLRLYEKYKNNDRVVLLSHSIDTRNDSVAALKKYADGMGIEANKWHLVTGSRSEIKRMAAAYMAIVEEDDAAPGGYEHSGQFVLVDEDKHIRSVCDGTDESSVTRFMTDIEKLLDEKR